MARKPKHHRKKITKPIPTIRPCAQWSITTRRPPSANPVFGQPEPTPDPTQFVVKHPSNNDAYKQIDQLNIEHRLEPMRFPAPRNLLEPVLTLAQILGGDTAITNITNVGQIVIHAVGDTGT